MEATPHSPTWYQLDNQDLFQPAQKFVFSPFCRFLPLKCGDNAESD